MVATPVVEMKDVSFSYGGFPVLQNVNISINELDFACIVGPNGGGKTTLLRLVLGLIKPDSGSVKIFGGPPEHARPLMGYMPQRSEVDIDFPVNVMDVVLMGRLGASRSFGYYSSEDRKAAMDVLEETGLLELRKRPFSDLSGGQRQRVLIARAIVSGPRIVLLDEPTLNLDVTGENQLNDLLLRLNQSVTLIMVSHNPWFVTREVTSVVCINKTCKIHPTSKITDEVLKELYTGGLKVIQHNHECAEDETC